MKIKCKPDGAPNVTGFGPPTIADPQPEDVAVKTLSDAPLSAQDTVHFCTPHVQECVYTAVANDNSKPQLPSNPTEYDTDIVNKHGGEASTMAMPVMSLGGSCGVGQLTPHTKL